MTETTKQNETRYGFLAVLKIADLGYCGGLLVLTEFGRPLEFHCTAPVNANRAQEILYGQTLESFLMCDQIGVALCEKPKLPLSVIVVEQNELASLSHQTEIPIAFVEQSNEDENPTTVRLLGGQSDATELIDKFAETIPLAEPFERIRRAIEEAHSVAA